MKDKAPKKRRLRDKVTVVRHLPTIGESPCSQSQNEYELEPVTIKCLPKSYSVERLQQ